MDKSRFTRQPADDKGSPGSGEPLFLAVGQLRRPHGIRGEMQMLVLTDFPDRLQPDLVVYLGERHKPHTIRSRRSHQDLLLVAFEGFPDRTSVETLRNQFVYLPAEMAPELPAGEFYRHELIDLLVVAESGKNLGVVEEILETGANDVLLVRMESGAELLLPLIDDVVREIDLESGSIHIFLMPGLLPGTGEEG
jgi:16S rRNA processing protein RimM